MMARTMKITNNPFNGFYTVLLISEGEFCNLWTFWAVRRLTNNPYTFCRCWVTTSCTIKTLQVPSRCCLVPSFALILHGHKRSSTRLSFVHHFIWLWQYFIQSLHCGGMGAQPHHSNDKSSRTPVIWWSNRLWAIPSFDIYLKVQTKVKVKAIA